MVRNGEELADRCLYLLDHPRELVERGKAGKEALLAQRRGDPEKFGTGQKVAATMNRTKAILALEDGKVFEGWAFGAPGERAGEVVFNTSMTGYQEILTDPSYKGQIVTMTYPLIGNYGVNEEDLESTHPGWKASW